MKDERKQEQGARRGIEDELYSLPKGEGRVRGWLADFRYSILDFPIRQRV